MSLVQTTHAPAEEPSFFSVVGPVITVVFVGFLIVGFSMPVLPLHVHDGLGMSTFAVGLVAGSQFVASLLSRVFAGQFSDSRGPKRAVAIGLIGAAASGGLYLLSLAFRGTPVVSVGVLLVGRALLGAAESFIITGALGWGFGLARAAHTGKVIAWVGSAMFAAFAVGAPMGNLLYASFGFFGVALATLLMPLATLAMLTRTPAVPASQAKKPSASHVLSSILLPGLGLAASSLGFGAITAFVSLLYMHNGWGAGWQAFTAFALALILTRALFGHLPDKLGGPKVAMVSILIEGAGQLLLWMAPSATVALLGAALTGLGYSLVYPAFGTEAVRKAPPESKGLVMGSYTACLDLTLGVGSPLLGVVGGHAGLPSVFLVSAGAALIGAAIALAMAVRNASPR
ncbi:arabinose transporter [Ralstonia pseudosolanacearum]|uniref:Major facilitator superfamily (MFS) profile domain-containing protein n=1 Tax=Ralstonia solanacearum TaxID=305 RepID=A0A0S4TWR5_RALSL|nr:MFS transporter [Ralstonia solanacearum]CUV14293.1 conserved membrane protein of unknown function [Ralstonia solanacearum]